MSTIKYFQYFPKGLMSIIGMVHVRPLPGTPESSKPFNIHQLIDYACQEASIYVKHGLHGILIENMFDRPYINSAAGPEITATMTRICSEIRRIVPDKIPCGVQVLAGLNKEALAVALASGFQFTRVEGFVFSHVADEGLMINACAGPLLRYRRQIDAEHISVWTDVKKKHCSHSITVDVDLGQTAKAASFFLSDAIIVTGRETGDLPQMDEIGLIQKSINDDNRIPLIIGSGVTEKNLSKLFWRNNGDIDGVIVGSHFKIDGKWYKKICENRVKSFMKKWNQLQTEC